MPDERAAVNHALCMAADGDFVTVFADNTTRSWKQIVHFGDEGQASTDRGAEQEAQPVDDPVADDEHADRSFTLGDPHADPRRPRGARGQRTG